MKRPSDIHWNLLTPVQRKNTRIILQALKRHRIRFVLGGGWAVFAHEASTPSVDCDVFLKGRLPKNLEVELSAHGIRVGPQLDLEFLPLDKPQALLGTGEEDLGLPPVSYLPSRIFKGRLESRRLDLDEPVDDVPLPDRVSLAVTKLAALQGRSLAYRSFVDGEARMRLGPGVVPQIASLGQSYYLRKAGKDLFDASLLLQSGTAIEEARELAGPAVWATIRDETRVLPPAITLLAQDMAIRVARPTPADLARTLAT